MSVQPFVRNALLAGAAVVLASTAEAQFFVRTVDAPGATDVTNINVAETLLLSEPTLSSGLYSSINFVGGGGDAPAFVAPRDAMHRPWRSEASTCPGRKVMVKQR